jgi:hypothetical protein
MVIGATVLLGLPGRQTPLQRFSGRNRAVEHEDLDRGIGVAVAVAHVNRHRATGQLLDGADQSGPHRGAQIAALRPNRRTPGSRGEAALHRRHHAVQDHHHARIVEERAALRGPAPRVVAVDADDCTRYCGVQLSTEGFGARHVSCSLADT